MSAPILEEPTARKISPGLFLLVLVCFVLPFMGVSCNSSASGAFGGLGGLGSGGGVAQKCLSGDLVTYSGLNMVTGADPSVSSDCQSGSSSGLDTSKSDPFKLGVQIAAILALVAVIAGLIVGALGLAKRGVITAGLALVSMILLWVNQSMAGSKILGNIKDAGAQAASSQSGGSGGSGGFNLDMGNIDFSSYFQINAKIGYILALLLLLVAFLYNAAGALVAMRAAPGAAQPSSMPMAAPPPPPPPPPGA